MTRVLILSPRHLTGYRDLVLADSSGRGESPVAVAFADEPSYMRTCSEWLDVSNRVAVYSDFNVDDEMQSVAEEANAVGVEVEWRCLGRTPKPTLKERIARLVA